ncbi:MAG TPA: RnfABCDGE type electron transport complex subunit D, partial [Rhodocyclaceae bacterium]|nr:RnfABCDGE type electron transport complex subunit D [Rhodocyclaceae bacterium]
TFGGHGIDAMSSATALGHVKTELARGLALDEAIAAVPAATERALGWQAGSAGETSALLLLAGGLFLIARRIVSWHIPAAALATVFALATVAHALDPQRFADGMFHVLCGATVLGAFFIATDPVTSAVSRRGQLVFGIGFGLFVWLIRSFSAYPEGVAFAVLLMNSLTPTIDRYTRPRVFGRRASGAPLPLKGSR